MCQTGPADGVLVGGVGDDLGGQVLGDHLLDLGRVDLILRSIRSPRRHSAATGPMFPEDRFSHALGYSKSLADQLSEIVLGSDQHAQVPPPLPSCCSRACRTSPITYGRCSTVERLTS